MDQQQQQQKGGGMASTLYAIFWVCIVAYAVYLSFQCNKGVAAGDIILALCCSPFYVAYRLAIGCA